MLYLPQLRGTKSLLPYHFEKFPPRVGEPDGQADVDRQSDVVDGLVEERASVRQPQILLIGDDPLLQFSRRKVLESAGYRVRAVTSNLIVEELLLRGIRLVLLCHSIAEDRMTEIVRAFARLAPLIPVLLISSSNYLCIDGERPLSVSTRPAALLGAVAATLARH